MLNVLEECQEKDDQKIKIDEEIERAFKNIVY